MAGALLARLAAGGSEDVPARFGHATAWSVGLTIAIWTFAVSGCASLLSAAWAFKHPGRSRRLVRCHDLAAAIVFVIVTVYLAFHGVIGYRTWA